MAAWRVVVVAVFSVALLACGTEPVSVETSGERDGLVIEAQVTDTGASIAVDVEVRNDRDVVVQLETDQCGRIADVELERTAFRPEGVHWDGSIQAVKELVLNDQRFEEDPDSFAPRRVGDHSSAVPVCRRPEHAISLEPGATIAERWELAYEDSRTLREVGSGAGLVSIEVMEARDPTAAEYWDIVYWADEEADRVGRVARAEQPLSDVLQRAATQPLTGLTRGELFDRLLDDDEIRAWIEAQPEDGWGQAVLRPAYPGYGPELERLRLEMVTTAFERSAVVTADPDGSNPRLDLPGEEFRTRPYPRTAGTLPPLIETLPGSDYAATDDLHIGEVRLPSGRVVVGEYLFDAEPLDIRVDPGPYPVHATLARYQDQEGESVAFASLVLSAEPTVRWDLAGGIAVDGGTTTFTSVEVRDELRRMANDDPIASQHLDEQIFNAMVAHDHLAAEWNMTQGTNLVRVSSGVGDGGYPVWIGRDAAGNPTRVVVDFYLLHLAWPGG